MPLGLFADFKIISPFTKRFSNWKSYLYNRGMKKLPFMPFQQAGRTGLSRKAVLNPD